MITALERYKADLEGILSRFKKTHDGIHIDQNDDARFREMALELRDLFDDAFVGGGRHSQPLLAYFNDSIANWVGSPSYRGVENVKGVVVSALARVRRNPLALKTAALAARSNGAIDPDVVVRLAERLHAVVRQLRERREERPTLDVGDEYDVQDLVHALLTIHFDDIRKEEMGAYICWRSFTDGFSSARDRIRRGDQDDAAKSVDKATRRAAHRRYCQIQEAPSMPDAFLRGL